MAFHLSRTLAIKAALVAGLLLIFFNLIGLRLEIKFDKSPINSAHTSVPLQWPKRTHTNFHHAHVTSPTTKQTPIETLDGNQNLTTATNLTTDNNVASNNLNKSTTNVESAKDILYSENGDIKFNILNRHIDEAVDLVNNNNSRSNISRVATTTTNVALEMHHKVKHKKPIVKKTKYQDFDASLVKDEGILNSIMKVFGLNQCPVTPPDLVGPIDVDTSPEYIEHVEQRLTGKISPGGRYKPSECRARDRVAIVVPYRDRKQHLPILFKNLHPFLMKQQIDYGIFLIEQSIDGSFNRAKLMNVGFVEALKLYEWDCFVFHDVDLLPMDDRNLYTCPDQPRHMSVAVDTFGFKLPYSSIFGGVSSMTTKQFKAVNGFSNSFWGWGGEDDDLSRRLKHVGYHIARYPVNIARYTMLTHKKEKANPKRYEKLVTGANRFNTDGLNSLKYKLLSVELRPLYTWIYVEITPETVSS
ncbi:CLUMA_CG002975, isoform A [Clunio marinus]|uniref:Beta-1,4-N-acetylgalactosaminyltransferase n=1 Tax=Clunio marinus TaxID=568069 RepID=A0A1J1HMC0_9DIPT|nr:CLUMA_CG002975, isoform A [Clunio marinus]